MRALLPPDVRLIQYESCRLRLEPFRFSVAMSATKILWGQIIVVFAIVLVAMWAATQWVAWKLG
jgi:hypothetical protein